MERVEVRGLPGLKIETGETHLLRENRVFSSGTVATRRFIALRDRGHPQLV